MTPAALRRARAALGWRPGRLAREAGLCSAKEIWWLERKPAGWRPCAFRRAREVLLEECCARRDARWRDARRARAERAWQRNPHDPRRPALRNAAIVLDHEGDRRLADWLLRAPPADPVPVVTMTAVHVLVRGHVEVWDALSQAGLIDHGLHDAHFLALGGPGEPSCFEWAPAPGQLLA